MPGIEGKVTGISSSEGSSIAVTDRGEAWIWGELKEGDTEAKLISVNNTAQKVSNLPSNITKIAAGYSHFLALTEDGKVYIWGANSMSELGDGSFVGKNEPQLLIGIKDKIIKIGAGVYHSVVLTDRGEVYAWGDNGRGQLGLGTEEKIAIIPTKIEVLNQKVKDVKAGAAHCLALQKDGTVLGWGDNLNGQLGKGPLKITRPTQIKGLGEKVVQISTGDFHSLSYSQEEFSRF